MRLDIQSRSFPLTPYLRRHVERRLQYALDQVQPRISKVTIRLVDLNGPRGGVDKHCGVVVRLDTGRLVVVKETADCAYQVVDQATARVKRRVKESLKRHRDRRRGRETIRRRGPGDGEDAAGTQAMIA